MKVQFHVIISVQKSDEPTQVQSQSRTSPADLLIINDYIHTCAVKKYKCSRPQRALSCKHGKMDLPLILTLCSISDLSGLDVMMTQVYCPSCSGPASWITRLLPFREVSSSKDWSTKSGKSLSPITRIFHVPLLQVNNWDPWRLSTRHGSLKYKRH